MTAADVWPIVCLTGPRPQHLNANARAWARAKLPAAAVWLRDNRGTVVGISGMALFSDMCWAEAVLDAGLILGAHVPFPQQPDRWTVRDRETWQKLLDRADPDHSRTYANHYSSQALHARNAGMIEASSAVVCVWCPNRREGGTWNAVRLAHRQNKAGIHLDPCRQTVKVGLPDITGRAAGQCEHGRTDAAGEER